MAILAAVVISIIVGLMAAGLGATELQAYGLGGGTFLPALGAAILIYRTMR